MILSDRELRNEIGADRLHISPIEDWQIQPASIDLTMDWPPKIYRPSRPPIGPFWDRDLAEVFDPENPHPERWKPACGQKDRSYILRPGTLLLASSREYIGLHGNLGAHINGLSSLGRMGFHIHASCSWFDPGFEGNAVLELLQTGVHPIKLRPGMRIAQLIVHYTSSESLRPYGHPELKSRYLGQKGAVGPRLSSSQSP